MFKKKQINKKIDKMYLFITLLITIFSIGYLIYKYRNFFIKQLIFIISPHLKDIKSESQAIIKNDIIEISYIYDNRPYKVYLPYKKIGRNISKFYLIDSEGNEKEITQQHGITYFVTPKQLGGTKIIVKHFDKFHNEFSEDQIPSS